MAETVPTQPGPPLSERSARVVSSRKLLRRAGRAKAQAFLAEGPQAVSEAIRFHNQPHPRAIAVGVEELYVDEQAVARHAPLVEEAEAAGIVVHRAGHAVLTSLSESVTPQGIVARCRFLDVTLDRILDSNPQLLAIPVDVRDPGNAGTIIRCADAAGADGVVLAGDSVDAFNGKAVRASAGSIFHIPHVRAADPRELVLALKQHGLQVVATEGAAPGDLDQLLDDGTLVSPTAWLFGNEARGLPEELAELADIRVRIPIHGLAESLNLSTAAAVCLFASARAQNARARETTR